jgi:hypothetical protein
MSALAVARARSGRITSVAWALIAWCVVCLFVGLIVLVRSLDTPVPEIWGIRGQGAIITGATVFVGGLLALKRPQNPVSWLILASGAVSALGFIATEFAIAAITAPVPGAAVAAWLWITWIPSTALLFETGLLFPNGEVVSPRWRFAVLAVALAAAAYFSVDAIYPGPLINLPYDNPFGAAAPPDAFADAANWVRALFDLSAILVVISLVLRYRASGQEVRQQLKLVVVAGSFGATTQFLAMVVGGKPLEVVALVGTVVVLVSIALAILKYGLYAIDLIIRRTLVYGATTVSVTAAFFAGIVLLQAVLRPLTNGSEVSVAASTLLTVGLFQPIRRRIQSSVDRRFYRRKYHAALILDGFAVRLRDEIDLDTLQAELIGAVGATVQPRHASLWLRSTH